MVWTLKYEHLKFMNMFEYQNLWKTISDGTLGHDLSHFNAGKYMFKAGVKVYRRICTAFL